MNSKLYNKNGTPKVNIEALLGFHRRRCMTNITLASLGAKELERVDLSIHPNKSYGNTSKPPKDGTKGKLGKARKALERRRIDYNATLGVKDSASYHRPGSMQCK